VGNEGCDGDADGFQRERREKRNYGIVVPFAKMKVWKNRVLVSTSST
jgi:hypothetical protein